MTPSPLEPSHQPPSNRLRWLFLPVLLLLLSSPAGRVQAAAEGNLVAREILVVTGIAEITGEEQWPADTAAAKRFQMVLEYMGYELHFRRATDLAKQGFPSLAPSIAGLILEGNIRLPVETERRFVDWIVASKSSGKKLLLLDSLPVRDHIEMRRLVRALGITGNFTELKRPTSVSFSRRDRSMMDFEAVVRPLEVTTVDLHAPANAEVYLSVSARRGASAVRFDPVFTASWGGVILAPYGSFQASDTSTLSYVDSFAFLARIWPEGEFPAPDVTTRDGVRAVFFHVDGDGFTTLSHSQRGVTSGKLITEQFLKRYPFPATASIIEADTRALQVGLSDGDQQRFEDEAREMFAIPSVEAASHTFSHPFIWIENDEAEYEDTYEVPFLKLKPRAAYEQIDYDREITGSVDYIEKELLPEGKEVEVLLWSGNCRPGPEALAAVRRRGLVSLNGGDTIISKRHPGISGIAPRSTYWADELQIYAPNQNDYVYTNDWEGPIYSGFAQAIETFELTGSPRRLKPVNVYYHFYSGAMLSSISALHQVYRWCASQELHSITAGTYARIARDSHHTEIYKIADRHWRIVNEGHLRTFRIPAELGFPDMVASVGLTGFKDEGAWRYIHTAGLPETHIVLRDRPQQHLHLTSSSAEIKFTAEAPDRVSFEATDLRPIQVVLGGAPPGEPCTVIINGDERQLRSDDRGQISIELPAAVIATVRTGGAESGKQAAK